MLRVHRRAGGAVAIALGVVIAIAGCTGGPAPTPTTTPPTPTGDGVLRIGTLLSTSGDAASYTAGALAAVNAAVREIDAAGGYRGTPVEVLSRNGGVAGDGAAEAAFAELVEQGVDVIIGPSTMEIAALLEPLAAQAGIPLISPIATGARPAEPATDAAADDAGSTSRPTLFRTVPSTAAQATYLADLLAADAPRVALLRADDTSAQGFSAALDAALAAADAELVADLVPGPDPAADAAQIVAATPDAVVVTTSGTGDDGAENMAALLAALGSAGLGGSALWFTGAGLERYDASAGPLEGANGIRPGVVPDPAFVAAVRQEDPGVRNLLLAPNAYDATVLAALAAVLAVDDGGSSIGFLLPAAAAGGIPCRSFGECLDTLTTQTDIAYQGVSGPLEFAENGDREGASYVRFSYDAENAPVAADDAGN